VRDLPENILHINLSDSSSRIEDGSDLFQRYLGGEGVAIELLLRECARGIDPFSPESPIILATGLLTGVYPCASKTVAMFRSPLTGNLGESHAGGHLATALRFAGYGAVVIKGASERAVALHIEDSSVKIVHAASLWGLSPLEVEKALRDPTYDGMQSVVAIGRGGENYVYFSSAIVDRFHHFGRLGLGAILGAKKLKAISVKGGGEVPLKNPTQQKSMYEEVYREVVLSGKMRKYHDLGTPENVLVLNEIKALPTRNFSKSFFDRAERISGQAYAELDLDRKISCPGCPIACIHLGSLSTEFAPQHESGRKEVFQESRLVPYNYEPIYALGSNLEVGESRSVLSLIAFCEETGIDAMMAGTVLAWATEAYEKGLITSEDTGGVIPRWGDPDSYLRLLENIVSKSNGFYARLAQGVVAAADKYGGKEFAVALGKNGLAGYWTGPGFIIGTLVGARHSHLSNAGYAIDQDSIRKERSPEEIADYLAEEEDWRCVLISLGICLFSRSIYSKELVSKILAIEGKDLSVDQLDELGREIFHKMYRFKLREGFDLEGERVPERLFETPTPLGMLDRRSLESVLTFYIKRREREGLRLRKEEKALLDLLSARKRS
jgi:aldehyde:ferredoxin oxidoreductase